MLIKIEDIKHNYPTASKKKQEIYKLALGFLQGENKK